MIVEEAGPELVPGPDAPAHLVGAEDASAGAVEEVVLDEDAVVVGAADDTGSAVPGGLDGDGWLYAIGAQFEHVHAHGARHTASVEKVTYGKTSGMCES